MKKLNLNYLEKNREKPGIMRTIACYMFSSTFSSLIFGQIFRITSAKSKKGVFMKIFESTPNDIVKSCLSFYNSSPV